MGGYVRQQTGVRVELLDLNYEGGDHQSLLRTIESIGPFLLIGLSCYSSFDYRRVMALAAFLKQRFPEVPLITGGYHATALPDEVVYEGSPFDAVLLGEGERPLAEIVKGLLGGGQLEKQRYGPDLVPELDALPPYAWDLLDRYWPRAKDLGSKFQVYLSRGCPYHCTFCMERSKSGYQWRAYSAERAIDELRRLAARTDLSHWVVNLADPLFGFRRKWRRQVLEGIIEHQLFPRQYWTLTRSDDLQAEDVSLLARARFSIGIGVESGSPTMLAKMQKAARPQRYLDALLRLGRLSREHGLNWAANLIIGHPGETAETMAETHAFATELFTSARETCGWISVDPFRLYPGAEVHEARSRWEKDEGAVFYEPEWWHRWADGPFHAQHIDPSHDLKYEQRVRFMMSQYGPLVREVQSRFRGQGRSVDRVYAISMDEQCKLLSMERAEQLISWGRRAKERGSGGRTEGGLALPLGIHRRDPWTRLRETAVRRLIDDGVLRTDSLIEALVTIGPEGFMLDGAARAVLEDRVEASGNPEPLPPSLSLRTLALGLEALAPRLGDRIVHLTAQSAYLSAILSRLVGEQGQIDAIHDGELSSDLEAQCEALGNVVLRRAPAQGPLTVEGQWDGLWIGAALPRFPGPLEDCLRPDGGRAIAFLGPRFRSQDLVVLTRREERVDERILARVRVPILSAPGGWHRLRLRAQKPASDPEIQFLYWPAPALLFRVLSHLDLGEDAANLYNREHPVRPWVESLARAYQAAPGRLQLHALALGMQEIPTLKARLRFSRIRGLDDVAGKRLCEALLTALEAEQDDFMQTWLEDADQGERLSRMTDHVGPALLELRVTLWAQQGRTPPPLRVLHCPALGPRARATASDGTRWVATSLDQSPEHVLLQVLHEEMHPLTDPVVLSEWAGPQRDTRSGTEGHALHIQLEQVAIGATQAVIEAWAPEHLPAFERWLERLE